MRELRILGYKLKNALAGQEDKLNISRNTLNRIYAGRCLIGYDQLKEISSIANVPITELLNGYAPGYYKDTLGMGIPKTSEPAVDKILNIIDDYIDIVEAIS